MVEDGSTVTGEGIFSATASSTGSIKAVAVAASASVTVGSGSVTLTGAGTGANATNTITNTVESGVIGGSSVDVDGAGTITATDTALVKSTVCDGQRRRVGRWQHREPVADRGGLAGDEHHR